MKRDIFFNSEWTYFYRKGENCVCLSRKKFPVKRESWIMCFHLCCDDERRTEETTGEHLSRCCWTQTQSSVRFHDTLERPGGCPAGCCVPLRCLFISLSSRSGSSVKQIKSSHWGTFNCCIKTSFKSVIYLAPVCEPCWIKKARARLQFCSTNPPVVTFQTKLLGEKNWGVLEASWVTRPAGCHWGGGVYDC